MSLYSHDLCLFILLIFFGSPFLCDDPQRPNYHVMPPSNWQNDPCGPFYLKPFYHLFYQYNPSASYWGDMHWGHVVSTDLAHWMHLDFALAPSESYDYAGIFTGSVTVIDGKPTAIYTGQTDIEQQCLAYPKNLSDPYLTEWIKEPSNPVILTPPPGVAPGDWRDPTTAWWVESHQKWHIVVGGTANQTVGGAFSYSSTSSDFLKWSYDNPLYTSTEYGNFECPDFFLASSASPTINTYHILKFSGENPFGDYVVAGQYIESSNTLDPESAVQRIDYGGNFYASKRFHDENSGRDILWGWVSEDDGYAGDRGWAGVQSIPRSIQYDPYINWIVSSPIQELALLHEAKISETNLTLVPNSIFSLTNHTNEQVQGQQYHLSVKFYAPNLLSSSQTFGIQVRETSDSSYFTSVIFQFSPSPTKFSNVEIEGIILETVMLPSENELHQEELIGKCDWLCQEAPECRASVLEIAPQNSLCVLHKAVYRVKSLKSNENPKPLIQFVSMKKHQNEYDWAYIAIDRSRSGTDGDIGSEGGFFPMSQSEEAINFEVFVDHSIVEVIVQGRGAVTSRVYPQSSDALDISVFSGSSQFNFDYSFWNMSDCWVEDF